MPILDIEIVGPLQHEDGLAQRLADAAGQALNSRPQGTWIKVHRLDADAYAENEGGGNILPVFIKLIQSSPPGGAQLDSQMSALTQAVALTLDRPAENVHILVEPPALGRISFGGSRQS